MPRTRLMAWGTRLLIIVIVGLLGVSCSGGPAATKKTPVPADDDASPEVSIYETALTDWRLHSSLGIVSDGVALSTPNYDISLWYSVKAPATVLAALVAAGVYPDPMYGLNLHELPGTLPIGLDVSMFPMPGDSPFRDSWWYRAEFDVPQVASGSAIWLRFEGVNFRANVWLNGHLIADRLQMAGTFREYEYNVTDVAAPGRANALAVEVIAPTPHDLAYNWVDWGPGPPDKNMGIFRDVKLLVTGPVAVRCPQVAAKLQVPGLARADLTVSAELTNAAADPVTGVFSGVIENIKFSQTVTLAAGETRTVTFAPQGYPQLTIANPRVWWPASMGAQNLYAAQLEFAVGNNVTDRQTVNFGIRDVQAPLTEEGYRYFIINGRKVLIRGGAWTSDLLLRHSHDRLDAEIRYAVDIGLNMLRMEGKLEFDDFYDLCDQYGIMLMPGWCCCDIWQFCETWDDENYTVAAESLRTQLRHMRNHPSVVVWLNGSDDPPSAKVERMYIDILKNENWPVPYLSSAGSHLSQVTGSSGVKMTGPYDYVPPEYWLADTHHGGAWGFNTETCPGVAIPPVEILGRFLPPDHMWPIDFDWDYHGGRGYYVLPHAFNQALDRRYGGAQGVDEYALKAQVLDYDNHRGMFEGYGQKKYHSTGVIQFLMNNAWPSLIWHLYDYYLYPGGAYFGAKKALEPLHVQYSYQDRAIVVVNSEYAAFKNMSVSASVLNFDLTEKFSKQQNIDIDADGVAQAFVIPAIPDLTKTYFLRLELADASGQTVSRNFYWLSTQPVIFLWNLTIDERLTPLWQDADLSMLNTLPPATLNASLTAAADEEAGWKKWQVHVANTGATLAFFVQLRLRQGASGDDVVPVYWEENYFSLFPNESRDITVRCRGSDLTGPAAAVEVSAWNVAPTTIVSEQ